jgi:hypothetical protein
MWFYAELERNPEILMDIVSEKDVSKIASIIGEENDDCVCSRISFELALGGDSGESSYEQPIRQPLIALTLDVLDEKFLRDQEYNSVKVDLEKFMKTLNELGDLINREDIFDILLYSNQFAQDELLTLKRLTSPDKETVFEPLFDANTYKRESIRNWNNIQKEKGSGSRQGKWRKTEYYYIFIKEVGRLYSDLVGKAPAFYFDRTDRNREWQPISKGAQFLFEFHCILNRLVERCSCKPFTDKEFKSACEASRSK